VGSAGSRTGVIAYQELDSTPMFSLQEEQHWSGRRWCIHYRICLSANLHWRNSLASSKTGATAFLGTIGLGGTWEDRAWAVSQHSSHRNAAIALNSIYEFALRFISNQVEESAIVHPVGASEPIFVFNASRNLGGLFEPRFGTPASMRLDHNIRTDCETYIDMHCIPSSRREKHRSSSSSGVEKTWGINGFKTDRL